jgi:hypothetical protein
MFNGAVRTLFDVKHIPNLKKNLILLGTLDHNRFSFKFEGEVLKLSKGVITTMMQ